jgi:fucose permease
LPEISAAGEDEASQTEESEEVRRFVETKKSVWQFPHLLLGILALFFYVGIDTLALVSPVDFANSIGLPHPERYTTVTVIAISIGCVLGIVLVPKYLSQLKGLQIGSLLALVLSFLIVLTPPQVAIYLVSLMSFALCLVWGAVWPLAIANLGKYTKTGSALLVSSCVGGAILPLIFGWFKDIFGGIQQAYWLLAPSVLFIVYYAFKGYKSGMKS